MDLPTQPLSDEDINAFATAVCRMLAGLPIVYAQRVLSTADLLIRQVSCVDLSADWPEIERLLRGSTPAKGDTRISTEAADEIRAAIFST